MDNYEDNVIENRKRNDNFLNEFEKYLKKNKLSDKTIRNHVSNVDLYINEFLNYYDVTKMEDGMFEIGMFLGDWYVRKCLWSTSSNLKTTAASIKKFYKCMSETGYVDSNEYKKFCSFVKEGMDDWISEMDDYNNFDEDDIFW